MAQEEEIIQATIKYNEASAKVEAFKDVERKIHKNFFRDFLKDKNRDENIKSIEDSVFIVNEQRYLCPFYVKNILAGYSVTYFDSMEYTFYYNILGNLIKFDKTATSSYPMKTYSYSSFGNLISVSFAIDEDEQYVYKENGKLIAHWVGNDLVKKPPILRLIDIKRGENNKKK